MQDPNTSSIDAKPSDTKTTTGFDGLDLAPPVLRAIQEIGYEQPSPIQARAIPELLAGRDLLGVAQTGTGKTAAFALPLLSRLDLAKTKPQILVLAPTRELAIQVSEAFQRYSCQMKGFHVVPLYGGQEYGGQLRRLKRGVHVVVGTPGRVMDHLKRGSLVLDDLQTLVLDEADEMLRMGFLDDVEWILQHTPKERQTALFSATMPRQIQKVASTYLRDPREVRIQAETATVRHTTQRACQVHGHDKLDALTRLLEIEDFDGMLVFVRTRTATVELAERIEARGFACDALNGDMNQQARERTVGRFRSGKLDILIATDVAARGIDVPRISHVINYDIPYDIEAYIHRVGRTGRAGRDGMAITFVTARETRLLRSIERATRSPIQWLSVPGREQLAERRITAFKKQMENILGSDEELDFFRKLIRDFSAENGCSTEDAAASLAFMLQQKRPLQPPPDRMKPQHAGRFDRRPAGDRKPPFEPSGSGARRAHGKPRFEQGGSGARQAHGKQQFERGASGSRPAHGKQQFERAATGSRPDSREQQRFERTPSSDGRQRFDRPSTGERPAGNGQQRFERAAPASAKSRQRFERPPANGRPLHSRDGQLDCYRIQVGREHGVTPGHIVGAIANEAGLDTHNIGRIQLFDKHSTVNLPRGMPTHVLRHLQKVRIFQQQLAIELDGGRHPGGPGDDRGRQGHQGHQGPGPFRGRVFQRNDNRQGDARRSEGSRPDGSGPARKRTGFGGPPATGSGGDKPRRFGKGPKFGGKPMGPKKPAGAKRKKKKHKGRDKGKPKR